MYALVKRGWNKLRSFLCNRRVKYKAVVSQKEWSKAVAKARAENTEPSLKYITRHLEAIEYITPVPDHRRICKMGGRGAWRMHLSGFPYCYFSVSLDRDKKLKEVGFVQDSSLVRGRYITDVNPLTMDNLHITVGTVCGDKLVMTKRAGYGHVYTILADLLGAEFIIQEH